MVWNNHLVPDLLPVSISHTKTHMFWKLQYCLTQIPLTQEHQANIYPIHQHVDWTTLQKKKSKNIDKHVRQEGGSCRRQRVCVCLHRWLTVLLQLNKGVRDQLSNPAATRCPQPPCSTERKHTSRRDPLTWLTPLRPLSDHRLIYFFIPMAPIRIQRALNITSRKIYEHCLQNRGTVGLLVHCRVFKSEYISSRP